MEFTKEIKDRWLIALKSGKYIQLQNNYKNKENNEYCCLAVLDEITDKLIYWSEFNNLEDRGLAKLIELNDKTNPNFKADYSNVIPFIERLNLEEINE